MESKIKTKEELVKIISDLKSQGKKIVTTNGAFDILHVGHINPEHDRALMLAALEVVDYVVLFNEDTPSELLDALKPDIHVKAADYNVDKMPETPVVRKNGGEVVCVPLEPGYATTDLIGEILKRFGDGEHEKVDSGRGGYEVGK